MRLQEWHRTVALVALIALAVGFIVWSQHAYDVNFVRSLR